MKRISISVIALLLITAVDTFAQVDSVTVQSIIQEVDSLKLVLQPADSPHLNDALSIGGAFDLIEGRDDNGVYAQAGVFVPDLWTFGRKHAVGFSLNLTRDRTFSTEQSRFDEGVEVRLVETKFDSVRSVQTIHRQTAFPEGVVNRESNNLGLSAFFSWNFPWVNNVSFLFHGEIRRKDVKDTFKDFDVLEGFVIDTDEDVPLTFDGTVDTVVVKNPNREVINNIYEWSGGIGLRLEGDLKSVNFGLQPIVMSLTLDDGTRNEVGVAYILDMWLVEKASGIKLGVQVRNSSFTPIEHSVYLAKQFSISKLFER